VWDEVKAHEERAKSWVLAFPAYGPKTEGPQYV